MAKKGHEAAEAATAPAAQRGAVEGAGAALCRALRDQPGQAPLLSAAKTPRAGLGRPGEPDLGGLAERFADSGYVDDAAFAISKARSLSGRGYGKRRLVEQLRAAGIEEDHSDGACEHADEQAVAAALRFAERRRIGPFASDEPDRAGREKAIAAMVRAGHCFALARAIAILPPGAAIDPELLSEQAGLTLSKVGLPT